MHFNTFFIKFSHSLGELIKCGVPRLNCFIKGIKLTLLEASQQALNIVLNKQNGRFTQTWAPIKRK